MTPELVIFDCDGVLVDSEALSVAALLGMIAAAGGTISEDTAYEHFLGKSMKSVREILGRDFGLDITDEHLTAMRVELHAQIPRGAEADPRHQRDAAEARRAAAASPRPARSTASAMRSTSPACSDCWSRICSVPPWSRSGKPAPDLFLHAARQHAASIRANASSSRTARPASRRRARRACASLPSPAARMPATRRLKARLASSEPDFIFADMLQLPDLIAGLGARVRAS